MRGRRRRRLRWRVGLAAAVFAAVALGSPHPAPAGRGVTAHEVKGSETLSGIARRYGISVREIVVANSLPGVKARLHPGRVLAIPSPRSVRAPETVRREPVKQAGASPVRVRRASLRSTSVREFSAAPPAGMLLAIPDLGAQIPEFVWPVDGVVSSSFGRRGRGWHRGVDIMAPEGTPIHAAAAGVVIASGVEHRYGRVVKIEHEGGVVTVYAHNLSNSVEVGARVAAGQEVGNVGSTGHATSAHLHFEIRHEGRVVNPLYLLPLPGRVATEDLAGGTEEEDE